MRTGYELRNDILEMYLKPNKNVKEFNKLLDLFVKVKNREAGVKGNWMTDRTHYSLEAVIEAEKKEN